MCELDIMFNLEKAHFILDEMVVYGCVVETNKVNILSRSRSWRRPRRRPVWQRCPAVCFHHPGDWGVQPRRHCPPRAAAATRFDAMTALMPPFNFLRAFRFFMLSIVFDRSVVDSPSRAS